MNKSQKVTLCVVLLIVLLIAWGLFPLFFKWLMIGIGSKETALKDFGTFGDIYGSLNTLFTSATLIIVMYSAYLQRQANNDAREAMEKQLQQAKEDTEKQLQQAREATQQQISSTQQLADIQLTQAKEVSSRQLELAQATHQEQLKESQIAIFNNKFFSFLKFKRENFEALYFYSREMDGSYKKITAQNLLEQLTQQIVSHLEDVSNDIENTDIKTIENYFLQQCKPYFEDFTKSTLHSYFLNYEALIKMVSQSGLDIS